VSPKPSEWPQAEQQLQKYESVAFDNSVPPGNKRRETVPYVKVEPDRWSDQINRRLSAPQNLQASLLSPSSSDTRQQDLAHLPPVVTEHFTADHMPLSSQLSSEENIWGQSTLSLMKAVPGRYSPHVRGPLPGLAYNMHSLATYMPHLLVPPPPAEAATRSDDIKPWQDAPPTDAPASPLGLQLQQFAAQAEDSARRARLLADCAAYTMLRLQYDGCNGNLPSHEGTPVDPEGIDTLGLPAPACPLQKNSLTGKTLSNGAVRNQSEDSVGTCPANDEKGTETTAAASCSIM